MSRIALTQSYWFILGGVVYRADVFNLCGRGAETGWQQVGSCREEFNTASLSPSPRIPNSDKRLMRCFPLYL